MPIDKRKMNKIDNDSNWCLSSIVFSSHFVYLCLIFLSLTWNAYNTRQNHLLTIRMMTVEKSLTELGITTTLTSNNVQRSFIEQWLNTALEFLPQFTLQQSINNDNNDVSVRLNKVRLCLIGNAGWKPWHLCEYVVLVKAIRAYSTLLYSPFISNMHNKLNTTIKAL